MEKIDDQKYVNLIIKNPENYSCGNITRAIFLSNKDKIIHLKKSGYPISAIWKLLTEAGEFNKGYGQFRKLYNALIIPILNNQNKPNEQTHISGNNVNNHVKHNNMSGNIRHSATADSNKLI